MTCLLNPQPISYIRCLGNWQTISLQGCVVISSTVCWSRRHQRLPRSERAVHQTWANRCRALLPKSSYCHVPTKFDSKMYWFDMCFRRFIYFSVIHYIKDSAIIWTSSAWVKFPRFKYIGLPYYKRMARIFQSKLLFEIILKRQHCRWVSSFKQVHSQALQLTDLTNRRHSSLGYRGLRAIGPLKSLFH